MEYGNLSTLYPPIEPYNSGKLKVSEIHDIFFEECGNKSGTCVVVVHGGPGGGIDPMYRRFFDPNAYRIVLFDQRGCGKSTPFSCLEENTTWDLVEDMEKIRKHLNIERWVVFGGSWGATLSLAYAINHPGPVIALVLRGIFTLRKKEILWFYQEGASFVYPEIWEKYLEPIPVEERGDMVTAYYKRLTGDDPEVRKKCAVAWTFWEDCTCKLIQNRTAVPEDSFSDAFARIENHYFYNKGFFKSDNQLIDESSKLASIPGVIVQGRYDMVCPMISAWELHKNWPQAELVIKEKSGHSCTEPEIISALVEATDKFRYAE